MHPCVIWCFCFLFSETQYQSENDPNRLNMRQSHLAFCVVKQLSKRGVSSMTKDKTKIHVRPKTELMTHGSSALALAPAIAPVYVPHVSPSTVSSISNTTHATQEPIIFDSNWVKAQEERNYARDDA